MRLRAYFLFGAIFGLVAIGYATSQGQVPEESDSKRNKAPTVTVRQEPMVIRIRLDGTFTAKERMSIAFRPTAWTTQQGGALKIQSVVPHGSRVEPGDTLIELDLNDLDQNLTQKEKQLQQRELEIELASKELADLDATVPLDLEDAERASNHANEDLKRFIEEDRAFSVASAEFNLKSSEQSLEYALEELQQLEKMYQKDDLTEETEEIILKRQRNSVAAAKHYLKQARRNRERTLNITLPRREVSLRTEAERSRLARDKAKNTLPLTLQQKRRSLDELRDEQRRDREKLRELKQDRQKLPLRAPVRGLVYHGPFEQDKWQGTAGVTNVLKPGAVLPPNKVLLTVVNLGTLQVVAEVDEKHRHLLKPGAKVTVVPTADPNRKLSASIQAIGNIPSKPGKFPMAVALDDVSNDLLLRPGMNCTVQVIPYRAETTLTVPSKAVFRDPLDEESRYVYRVGADGRSTRCPVKIGRENEGKLEILDGLEAGDEICQTKPEGE